jgi:hypothetical protein
MQRSAQSAIVSGYGTPIDRFLLNIKTSLSGNYWKSDLEGVFAFQFLTENTPLTNVISPHMFQIVRYTPDFNYESFQTTIPGRLNSDGSFEYGGGRYGQLNGNQIIWKHGGVWDRVYPMIPRMTDLLNIDRMQAQAELDSKSLMGGIYQDNYLY